MKEYDDVQAAKAETFRSLHVSGRPVVQQEDA
jgi:hypothetical protein